MKEKANVKQIAVRFDRDSYDKIVAYSKLEHRGLGEFVRHATLTYVENYEKEGESSKRKEVVSDEKI